MSSGLSLSLLQGPDALCKLLTKQSHSSPVLEIPAQKQNKQLREEAMSDLKACP